MIERRKGDPRDPSFIQATIRLDDGVEVPCIVENITVCGAKLRIDPDQCLPERFDLAFPLFDSIVDVKPSRLRWRDRDVAGVNFAASV